MENMQITEEMKKGVEGIHIVANISKDITITYPIIMPQQEVLDLRAELIEDSEEMKEEVADLYFGVGLSQRQIAKQLKLGKTQVDRYVQRIRKDLKKDIKQDIRNNKKVFDKMMKLLTGIGIQKRMLWQRQFTAETESEGLTKAINQALSRMKDDKEKVTADLLRDLIEPMKQKKSLWDIQESVHHLLRQNMLAELDVLYKFGLCGKEAVEVVLSGGIDVDVMVTQMREHYVQIQNTIIQEVKDEDTRRRVFGRMAVLIKQLSEEDKWSQQ